MDVSGDLTLDFLMIPCRACTRESLRSKMYFLYRDTKLVETFSQFSTLEIYEADGLPTHICEECYGHLDDFIHFRKVCLTSDESFRQKTVAVAVKNEVEINASSGNVKLETLEIAEYISGKKSQTIERDEIQIKIEDFSYPSDHYEDAETDSTLDSKQLVHRVKRIKTREKKRKPKAQNTTKTTPETRNKFICDECGRIFHKKHRIQAHLRQHLGLKPFECQLCDVSFRKWASFNLHNKVNHSDNEYKKFECNFEGCEKSYNLKQSLNIHTRTAHYGIPHRKPKSSFICETCGKAFSTQFSLKEHNYTHTGETPFPCTQCPKKFISKYKLKIHLMRHNNIRNHVCSECGLRKTTQKELRIHMNMHTQEKTYPCEYCPAVFRNYQNINRHNRIVHRGYKPYICTYCQRSFSKAETLKHHTMIHTGEKPHACTICAKRFIQAVALKTHMKVHNKHKIFSNSTD